MKLLFRQIIAGIFTLLFLVGQCASLAHAAEHPFHQADDFCTSFIHCEKQDLSSGQDNLNASFSVVTAEVYVFSKQPVNAHFFFAYSSRAPPVTS